MKIRHSCPKVGLIEYEVDEAELAASLYPQILMLLSNSPSDIANIIGVFYPMIKAMLEEEYILVPREA